MTIIQDRYCIETDFFVHSSHSTKPLEIKVQYTTNCTLYIHKTQIFRVFQVLKFFQKLKLSVVNLTHFILHNFLSDLFVTYTDGFKMHAGQPKEQFMINEYISGKIVLDNSDNNFIFPALNVSNNFATIEYDAHINTKID